MSTDNPDTGPKPPHLTDAEQRRLRLYPPGSPEAMGSAASSTSAAADPVSERPRASGARGMAARDSLRLEAPPPAPASPPQPSTSGRGRLLEAHEVALEFYHGKRSTRWVLENLRHCRAKIPGRQPLHWESLICAELGVPFPRSGS